ncbi:uncharacterized protein ACO6RY_17040 [Pungitius sinensis]
MLVLNRTSLTSGGVFFSKGGGALIPKWNEFSPATSLGDRLRAVEQRCQSTEFRADYQGVLWATLPS